MTLTNRQRMDRILKGQAPDRVPFVPSVYEHGARLIHQFPGPVSRDAGLTAQAARLSATGCGVNLYESWATIPLITPALFEEYVVPYNRQVIEMVRNHYDTEPPAVIMGGNINRLVDFFIKVGTSLMVVDYKADFDVIESRTAGTDIIIRGCVDPKLIEREDWEVLQQSIDQLARKSRGMNNFVWGCGCVTYDTSAENLLRFKDMCLGT